MRSNWIAILWFIAAAYASYTGDSALAIGFMVLCYLENIETKLDRK